jgi:hypothetical protein
VRRRIATAALEGDVDAQRNAEFAFSEELDESTRKMWGSLHPAFLGGEFLPPMLPDEIEVANIALASTTADVIQVRARREGGRIVYRVVDEYAVEFESRFEIAPSSSDTPLSLGELIDLIDGARQVGGMRRDKDRYDVGLTDNFRFLNSDETGDAESVVDFVRVTSAHYPRLEDYYTDRAQAWLVACLREWEDEVDRGQSSVND